MRTNSPVAAAVAKRGKVTHEGAPAKNINKEQELRRSVMACLLWEDSFYESGESIADRIKKLVHELDGVTVSKIAVEARSQMNLRHAPLYLARELARHPNADARTHVAETLEAVIQRPDELAEYLAIYWKEKKQPLSSQTKKGLARAFTKFNEYQLAKYNRDGAVKLRDVLFLTHGKPKNKEQEDLWKKLTTNGLATPDTWEVALSAGQDKKEAFTRLLEERKLGALALLRNLRNMETAKVDRGLIREALTEMRTERVLPFRFISAAKYAPVFEPELEQAMFKNLVEVPKLKGKTALLVDMSGSMRREISSKSELMRYDAANALAILAREICDEVVIIAFGSHPVLVPSRRGFALRDAITSSSAGGGTNTEDAKRMADREGYDRVIIFTDEQSHQSLSNPNGKGYCVNIAAYRCGIGYGKWIHIDGFSESIVKYIMEYENAGF